MNYQTQVFRPDYSCFFKSLVMVAMLTILFSCGSKKPVEVFVQTPVLLPESSYLNPVCNEAFFMEAHFSYNYNLPGDSTKLFYTSEIIAVEDSAKYCLRICKATQSGDSLQLQFTDDSLSFTPYELKIVRVGEKIVADYNSTIVITDSSWRPTVFKTIEHHIFLDKPKYQKGDSLKGKLVLKMSALYSGMERYTDTVRIFGLIKTIVD